MKLRGLVAVSLLLGACDDGGVAPYSYRDEVRQGPELGIQPFEALPLPDGRVVFVGATLLGSSGQYDVELRVFDPATDELLESTANWTTEAPARGVTLPDGRVLLLAGRLDDTALSRTYDADTDRLEPGPEVLGDPFEVRGGVVDATGAPWFFGVSGDRSTAVQLDADFTTATPLDATADFAFRADLPFHALGGGAVAQGCVTASTPGGPEGQLQRLGDGVFSSSPHPVDCTASALMENGSLLLSGDVSGAQTQLLYEVPTDGSAPSPLAIEGFELPGASAPVALTTLQDGRILMVAEDRNGILVPDTTEITSAAAELAGTLAVTTATGPAVAVDGTRLWILE